jgi:hypothetical protein
MRTAVLYNIVQSCRNAGISLILDDVHVIRCEITPNAVCCIIDTLFADRLGDLATKEEKYEGEDPNLEIFEMRMLDLWESKGESGNGE